MVHLKPGDTIVQQATNHAWVNHGTEMCRILFALMVSKQPWDMRSGGRLFNRDGYRRPSAD